MTAATSEILVQCQRVVFRNRDIPLVGLLWLPSRLTARGGHPAIVIATPGNAVKEQVGAAYAKRLVKLGFLALTFDPSFQGESGGRPRERADAAARIADLGAAVDFLSTLPLVDAERIGVLALGAGHDYAAPAARADPRIKALGHVAPVDDPAISGSQPGAVGLALLRMEALFGEWAPRQETNRGKVPHSFTTAANDVAHRPQALASNQF